jgi:glu_cys_lig_rel: glutamate--cysteine ligase/gamma-glutamylcysteine synthetase
LKSLN